MIDDGVDHFCPNCQHREPNIEMLTPPAYQLGQGAGQHPLTLNMAKKADAEFETQDVIGPGGHSVEVTPFQSPGKPGFHGGSLGPLRELGVQINGGPVDMGKYFGSTDVATLSHQDPQILDIAKRIAEEGSTRSVEGPYNEAIHPHQAQIDATNGISGDLHQALGAFNVAVENPQTGHLAPYAHVATPTEPLQHAGPLRIGTGDPELTRLVQEFSQTGDKGPLVAYQQNQQQKAASLQKQAFLPLLIAGGAALGGAIGGLTSDGDNVGEVIGDIAIGAGTGAATGGVGGAAAKGLTLAAAKMGGYKALANKGVTALGMNQLVEGAQTATGMQAAPGAAGGAGAPVLPQRSIQQLTHMEVLAEGWHPSSDPKMHEDQKELKDGDTGGKWDQLGNESGGTDSVHGLGEPDSEIDLDEIGDLFPKLIEYYFSDDKSINDDPDVDLSVLDSLPQVENDDPDHGELKGFLAQLGDVLIQMGLESDGDDGNPSHEQQKQEWAHDDPSEDVGPHNSKVATRGLDDEGWEYVDSEAPPYGQRPKPYDMPQGPDELGTYNPEVRDMEMPCPTCKGQAAYTGEDCPQCRGFGVIDMGDDSGIHPNLLGDGMQQLVEETAQPWGDITPIRQGNAPVLPMTGQNPGHVPMNPSPQAPQMPNQDPNMRTCPRGHPISPEATTCPVCGDGTGDGPNMQQSVTPAPQQSTPPMMAPLNPQAKTAGLFDRGPKPCVRCNGTGIDDSGRAPCLSCNGSGVEDPPGSAPRPPITPEGLEGWEHGFQSAFSNPHTGTQHAGPHNNEQFAAVAELLMAEGRDAEIPEMLAEPWNYAEELSRAQNKQIPPPVDETLTEAPPQPAQEVAPPEATMPVPGMQPPMPMAASANEHMMVATEKYATPDSFTPRCPNCGSGSTGLDSEDGDCSCHACGKSFKKNVVKDFKEAFVYRADHEFPNPESVPAADQDRPRDIEQEQDSSLSWTDQEGNPLHVNEQYEMHIPGVNIPDIVRVTAVKPDAIEVEYEGEYGIKHGSEILRQEASIEGLEFVRLDAEASAGEDAPDPSDASTADSVPEVGPGDQTDLSTPHVHVGAADDWEQIFEQVKQGVYGDWHDVRQQAVERIQEYSSEGEQEPCAECSGNGVDEFGNTCFSCNGKGSYSPYGISSSDVNHTIYGMIKSGELQPIQQDHTQLPEPVPGSHPDDHTQLARTAYEDDPSRGRCPRCGYRSIEEDPQEHDKYCTRDGCGWQESDGYGEAAQEKSSRTAGAKFTPKEQKSFIDEPGVARNKDKLNLAGTHYEEPFFELDEDDFADSFLFGL
jgi:hypothetical protein